MELLYILVLLASFAISFVLIKYLKGRLLSFGIGGIDINKKEKPRIPEAGGILILPAIFALVILLVESGFMNPLAYALLFTMGSFAAMGFFDDGFRLFRKEEGWLKYLANRGVILFLLTLPFTYLVFVPLWGFTAYWTLLFGIVIILAASLGNSFAGLNGWEVGSSTIMLAGLTVMVSFSQIYTQTLLAICLIILGSALALFYFNRYPAHIFPGDSGTLLLGSFMGCMLFFVEHWYIAIGLFYPHIMDILLKIKTNPRDISQKKDKPYATKGGKLQIPNSGKLDFAKFLIKKLGPMSEKKLSSRILRIVVNNTLFWTLLYIIVEII